MHGIQYSTDELQAFGEATSAAPSALHLLQDEPVDVITGEVQDLGEIRDWASEIDAALDTDTLNRLWTEAPATFQDAMRNRAAQLTTPTEGAEA